MRDGDAWDYLTKPFESIDQLKVVVSRAIDHRRLLKARRDEEERLRALVANIGDALLAVSDDGRVAIANPAAQRLLGRSDLQGQPVDEVLPTRLAQVLRNWQRMGRPHPASMELSWSGERQVLVTLTPLPGEGWVMALSDITHLKQAEMLKNQAMAEMLARLRLPMASAMSAIIDLNASTGPDHPLADKLFRLTDIWEKMQAWGDELAAMVQGDASHTLSAALVNVYQALQKTLQSKAVKAFQRSGVGLNLDCDDASPNLYTDPDLFQQLLSNLVARAMQRTPPGQAVNLRLRTEDQQVWLEVCDAGPENDPSIPDIELAHARSLVARLDGQLWSAGVCRESSLTVCFPAA
jgi:PAS domain S-box-containing protein